MLLRREPTKNTKDLAATDIYQKTQLLIDMVWIGNGALVGGQSCKIPMEAGLMIGNFEAEVVRLSLDHYTLYSFRLSVNKRRIINRLDVKFVAFETAKGINPG
jgi:hypothetical protein